MKRTLFLLYILALVTFNAVAQSFTLQGRVTDEQSEPLEFATVACVSQGKIAMTSLKGEFSLQLHSADSVVIRFSMVGYKTKTRVLRKPRGKQTLQVVMYSDNTLSEVTVTEMKRQTGQTQELKKENMQHTPSTTGNAVEELIQSQAGVSTHSELSAQYNVRGGSFDENSVYINNVELYRPLPREKRTARRPVGHQPRHGRQDRVLNRRLRSKIWRQDVVGSRHNLQAPQTL